MRITLPCVALVLSLATPLTANAAPILNVVGGELLGASGVDVGGSLYDVAFLDGTCVALFSGCDSPSDYTFQSFTAALTASQALLDQVFLDDGLGLFDTAPELTVGCNSAAVLFGCAALTPYANLFIPDFVNWIGAHNTAPPQTDGPIVGQDLITQDLSIPGGDDTSVWAVWTPQQVPEPATLVLIGSGLVSLGLRRHRRVRATGPGVYGRRRYEREVQR